MSSSRKIGGRRLAFLTLERWERESLAQEVALEQVCREADPRERALALELTLGVLRWRSRLDDLLARLLRQPLHKLHPAVLGILRLGIYQLRSMSRTPARAVVHESVELCRQADVPWGTGLVNGVLRRYDREREALEAVPAGHDVESIATRWAHPPWFVRQLQRVAGAELEPWLEANNAVPPLTLRANAAKVSRAAAVARLREAGFEVRETLFSPDGIVLESGGAVTALPGFEEGWLAVQDEASQLVGLMLGVRPGDQVLDACAAPGGKTAHLAGLAGIEGSVFATDVSRERLATVTGALERLGPGRVTLAQVDWTQPPEQLAQAKVPAEFDRVLVDAPCSGFGVVRRKPEIKWRRKAEDVTRYPARQLSILEAVATRVRPGGTLVYSVCTPLLAEGPEVVRAFLARSPDFRRVDLRTVLDSSLHPLLTPEGYMRTTPHRHGCDAFFAARLERVADTNVLLFPERRMSK